MATHDVHFNFVVHFYEPDNSVPIGMILTERFKESYTIGENVWIKVNAKAEEHTGTVTELPTLLEQLRTFERDDLMQEGITAIVASIAPG